MQRPDGRLVYAHSTVVPEFSANRKAEGFFVLSFDIIKKMPTGASIVDRQLRVLFWKKAVLELLDFLNATANAVGRAQKHARATVLPVCSA